MTEIRIHGRGGQGAVIASRLIAEAAFRGGRHVQAFPAFGSERRGAPVTAFVRLDRHAIRIHSEIYRPDALIVLDPSLISLKLVDVTVGLKSGGWILINTARGPESFGELARFRVAVVNAGEIASRLGLGTRTAPLVNTAVAGAFIELLGIATLDQLADAIRGIVPVKPEANVAAAREGALAVSTLAFRQEVAG